MIIPKAEQSRCAAGAVKIQGTIANARAGNPEPPFGFGKVTTAIEPASGTWSRFVSNSI
jgi:hypothetical protein